MNVKKLIAVAAVAASAMAANAETHTLQPYAYVQSHGVNRVDTGYCAKALSRYFIDFQLTQASLDNQGIFGSTAENPNARSTRPVAAAGGITNGIIEIPAVPLPRLARLIRNAGS